MRICCVFASAPIAHPLAPSILCMLSDYLPLVFIESDTIFCTESIVTRYLEVLVFAVSIKCAPNSGLEPDRLRELGSNAFVIESLKMHYVLKTWSIL
jgi:hypothetical protein